MGEGLLPLFDLRFLSGDLALLPEDGGEAEEVDGDLVELFLRCRAIPPGMEENATTRIIKA